MAQFGDIFESHLAKRVEQQVTDAIEPYAAENNLLKQQCDELQQRIIRLESGLEELETNIDGRMIAHLEAHKNDFREEVLRLVQDGIEGERKAQQAERQKELAQQAEHQKELQELRCDLQRAFGELASLSNQTAQLQALPTITAAHGTKPPSACQSPSPCERWPSNTSAIAPGSAGSSVLGEQGDRVSTNDGRRETQALATGQQACEVIATTSGGQEGATVHVDASGCVASSEPLLGGSGASIATTEGGLESCGRGGAIAAPAASDGGVVTTTQTASVGAESQNEAQAVPISELQLPVERAYPFRRSGTENSPGDTSGVTRSTSRGFYFWQEAAPLRIFGPMSTAPRRGCRRTLWSAVALLALLVLAVAMALCKYPYITVALLVIAQMWLLYLCGEEPLIQLVTGKAKRSKRCGKNLHMLVRALRTVQAMRSSHEKEHKIKAILYSTMVCFVVFNPDVGVLSALLDRFQTSTALMLIAVALLTTTCLAHTCVQLMHERSLRHLPRPEETPRGSEAVQLKMREISNCLQGHRRHHRTHARRIHDIFATSDAGTLNELLERMAFSSEVSLERVLGHFRDTHEHASRSELIELLCVHRAPILSVRSKAALLHTLMVMRLSSSNSAAAGVESLLLSAEGDELSELKCLQDGHGDIHSMHKLVFQDIPDGMLRNRVLNHILSESTAQVAHRALMNCKQFTELLQLTKRNGCIPKHLDFLLQGESDDPSSEGSRASPSYSGSGSSWLKIITDMDDTLECSGARWPAGIDARYTRHTVYPGITAFYRELTRGGVESTRNDETVGYKNAGQLVALSARPHIVGELVEQRVFKKFKTLMEEHDLHTMPALLTGTLDAGSRFVFSDGDDDGMRALAQKKYESSEQYIALYPEFRVVFVGDNGQADYMVGKMISHYHPNKVEQVMIHQVQPREKTWGLDLREEPNFPVAFFEDYVDAAICAATRPKPLISPHGLRRVLVAAAGDFRKITNWTSDAHREAEASRMNGSMMRAMKVLKTFGVDCRDVELLEVADGDFDTPRSMVGDGDGNGVAGSAPGTAASTWSLFPFAKSTRDKAIPTTATAPESSSAAGPGDADGPTHADVSTQVDSDAAVAVTEPAETVAASASAAATSGRSLFGRKLFGSGSVGQSAPTAAVAPAKLAVEIAPGAGAASTSKLDIDAVTSTSNVGITITGETTGLAAGPALVGISEIATQEAEAPGDAVDGGLGSASVFTAEGSGGAGDASAVTTSATDAGVSRTAYSGILDLARGLVRGSGDGSGSAQVSRHGSPMLEPHVSPVLLSELSLNAPEGALGEGGGSCAAAMAPLGASSASLAAAGANSACATTGNANTTTNTNTGGSSLFEFVSNLTKSALASTKPEATNSGVDCVDFTATQGDDNLVPGQSREDGIPTDADQKSWPSIPEVTITNFDSDAAEVAKPSSTVSTILGMARRSGMSASHASFVSAGAASVSSELDDDFAAAAGLDADLVAPMRNEDVLSRAEWSFQSTDGQDPTTAAILQRQEAQCNLWREMQRKRAEWDTHRVELTQIIADRDTELSELRHRLSALEIAGGAILAGRGVSDGDTTPLLTSVGLSTAASQSAGPSPTAGTFAPTASSSAPSQLTALWQRAFGDGCSGVTAASAEDAAAGGPSSAWTSATGEAKSESIAPAGSSDEAQHSEAQLVPPQQAKTGNDTGSICVVGSGGVQLTQDSLSPRVVEPACASPSSSAASPKANTDMPPLDIPTAFEVVMEVDDGGGGSSLSGGGGSIVGGSWEGPPTSESTPRVSAAEKPHRGGISLFGIRARLRGNSPTNKSPKRNISEVTTPRSPVERSRLPSDACADSSNSKQEPGDADCGGHRDGLEAATAKAVHVPSGVGDSTATADSLSGGLSMTTTVPVDEGNTETDAGSGIEARVA
eukprot:TRINITY_DN23868_c0_g1_i2.p1 TRINITY_DN23868_c0_g1~~TRINITY_DN23868_c0_g1_i2.p1  ORF type:complete len:1905 (+),score=297.54 TRINITY_DN23868_c0_g1_i2:134-5848(+)